jgi:twitching motility protein PilT
VTAELDPTTSADAGPDAAEGGARYLRLALEELVSRGASDLHMKVGRSPMLRVHGAMVESGLPPLRPDDMRRFLDQLLSEPQRESFQASREIDFAFGIQGLGRFRTNAFHQRGTPVFAFRAIPVEIPAMEALGLPPVIERIARSPRGLILVTGVSGSGKSTTLASIITYLNEHQALNIVTVEDPIEFLFRDRQSFISQREVGQDTLSFGDALKRVLRQDPDVIMLGELRDRETMETALKAADTGHLVMSTLHTTDASQTIGRIISFFPPHQHAEVRMLLANTLRAVISLRLIPRVDKPGRVPAAEVLVNTAAVADLIRAGDQLQAIPELMAEGGPQYGMQTFDQSLMGHYRGGRISMESALHYASNPGEFEMRVAGVESGGDVAWDRSAGGEGGRSVP